MFDRCSIDVRSMFDRCSIDVRSTFYRCAIEVDVRSMFVRFVYICSLDVPQMLLGCSTDARWVFDRFSTDCRQHVVNKAMWTISRTGSWPVHEPVRKTKTEPCEPTRLWNRAVWTEPLSRFTKRNRTEPWHSWFRGFEASRPRGLEALRLEEFGRGVRSGRNYRR